MNENTNQKTSKKISAKKRDGPESNLLLEAIKSCDERYQHWQNLYEEGGSDPSYADGVSLSLVRNHIIWRKKQIETACQALGCGLPDIHSRELPPEVAPGYMAKAEEIRENAKAALAVFEKDKEYRALLKEGKGLSEKQKEQVNYSAVIGYVSKLKTALRKDDLVTLRRYRRADIYADSIRECLKRVKELNPEPYYQLTLFDMTA